MKTIKDTGPLFYAAQTMPEFGVPPGMMRMHFVRYSTMEIPLSREFDSMNLTIHDANCAEAKEIAKLVKL